MKSYINCFSCLIIGLVLSHSSYGQEFLPSGRIQRTDDQLPEIVRGMNLPSIYGGQLHFSIREAVKPLLRDYCFGLDEDYCIGLSWRAGLQCVLVLSCGSVRLCFSTLGQDSIAAYSIALLESPNDAMLHMNRGRAFMTVRQFDRALSDFDSAVRLNPANPIAYYLRGRVLAIKRQWEPAIRALDESIRRDPSFADSYKCRAYAWYGLGQCDNAVADFTRSLALRPSDAIAYRNRGDAYHEKGEYDKAIEDYNASIELNPMIASTHNNRSNSYLMMRRPDLAIAGFEQAIRLEPMNYSFHESLAWALASGRFNQFRDGPKAVREATVACDLSGWKVAHTLSVLAVAYAEIGNFPKAIELQEMALRMETDRSRQRRFHQRLTAFKDNLPFHDTM